MSILLFRSKKAFSLLFKKFFFASLFKTWILLSNFEIFVIIFWERQRQTETQRDRDRQRQRCRYNHSRHLRSFFSVNHRISYRNPCIFKKVILMVFNWLLLFSFLMTLISLILAFVFQTTYIDPTYIDIYEELAGWNFLLSLMCWFILDLNPTILFSFFSKKTSIYNCFL